MREQLFWWVDNYIIDDAHIARMGLEAFAVYCVAVRCSGLQGFSDRFVEEKTGLSRAKVIAAYDRLRQLGYIQGELLV